MKTEKESRTLWTVLKESVWVGYHGNVSCSIIVGVCTSCLHAYSSAKIKLVFIHCLKLDICVYRSSKATCFTSQTHLWDSECGCIMLKNIYKWKPLHVTYI